MKEIIVPWSVVRWGIHVAYDYYNQAPQQFEYLAKIEDEDLIELETYCRLQINYDTPSLDTELDWSDTLKFVLIEREYRQSQDY